MQFKEKGHPCSGKKYTQEHKDKIRKAHKKTSVLQYDKDLNFIKQYESLHELQRQTGFFRAAIIPCFKNPEKMVYGYFWKKGGP